MLYESWVSFNAKDTESTFDRALEGLGRLSERIDSDIQLAILDETLKAADEAKQKVLSEPTHGSSHTGLRAKIAAGVKVVEIDGGFEIQVEVPESNLKNIPWGMDSTSQGWWHPVFGKKPYVHQRGTVPWWSEPTSKAESELKQKIPRAIDEAVKEVFGS